MDERDRAGYPVALRRARHSRCRCDGHHGGNCETGCRGLSEGVNNAGKMMQVSLRFQDPSIFCFF